ncbi:apoptosis-stimulating of p53 protein 1-like isoform X3 [Solea senegalensis]|uniref:Apoptosis-stimulating of p53 protein 1-like isoform X3 n=4 Tax=Solea senegalensis TaxID=28829 RepID=A0AAV6S512_SOLSE|nr:protein phosphatase 1, regulatory subunit 13Ba isoform X4 [Solea senegalensis]KAG7510931.1 apoptosis-stimulating of p53 protein 1-like isoform X3 [Solea senegalensis]
MRRFFGRLLEQLLCLSKNLKVSKCSKARKKPASRGTKPVVILTIYLNDTQQMLTEVPVTPATRVRDVVEYCKEPGEGECHLAEKWNGHERVLPLDILMLDLLQQWGTRRNEVSFYLRHCPPWAQGSQQPLDESWTLGSTEIANDMVPRVELTLSELQEMATRQQQQIETQQQMLVAKEQRLRYLHQGGRTNQGQTQSESEKLQRLKERVETQEAKLKKIRAMRGQVDYSKLINGNLSAEIDHVSNLFQEKQAELQSAVFRVDQLTQQLEDLRRGHLHSVPPAHGAPTSGQRGSPLSGPAALELRKLYQELQARNRHNLEQSSKLAQNKELLNKRNGQVTVMDQRIGELRERLHKKRAELNHMNGGGPASPQTSSRPSGGVLGRVAAVCPYIQVPAEERQESVYPLPTDPSPKPTPLSHTRSLSANEASWSDWRTNSPEQLPSSYGTYPSAIHQAAGHHCATSSLPRSAPGTLGWPRSSSSTNTSPSSSLSSSSQQIHQRIAVPPKSSPGSASISQSSPRSPQAERTDPPPAVAVRPYVPDHPSRPQSPRKGPATMNSSSIYSMYLQQPQAKNYGSLNNRTTVKAVYGKPILPTSSASPSPVPFLHGGGGGGLKAGEDVTDKEGGKGGESSDGQILPPPSVDNIPRPLSPTKLTPVAHSQLRYQSDVDLEVLRRRPSNAPRPLKKRSSITEPEGPQGPNIQKLLYQRFNTLAGGMEVGSGSTFYQPDCLLGDMDNIHSANGNVESGDKDVSIAAVEGKVQNLNLDSRRLSPPSVATETSKETKATAGTTPSTQTSPRLALRQEDQNNNNKRGSSPAQNPAGHASPSPAAAPSLPKVKRTNLKKPSSERTGHGLRVKFNPLALLLDASLEGEFDLVQRIIYEVENPSMPNDEGITPLHNAVCAGHHHTVKFLLDFGVNVNAADSDGWTPLHCAASCNSVHLCKMLVESGAAIFATTISDVETAADKCEEMEDGYTQCSQFLYGVQEKLGVMNKGLVYALWDYTAQEDDELSFSEGSALTVLRRHDDSETEWWWARLNDQEGYVPRNLLGLYPRIKPRQRSLA